jgi:hypothetical protein
VISLPKKVKLGGFAFTATYDPAAFHASQPVVEPALQGYICQANVEVPGTIRYNCVGLPNDERGGRLAVFPVKHAGRVPVTADFTVTSADVVDDYGNRIEGLRVEASVEPAPAP